MDYQGGEGIEGAPRGSDARQARTQKRKWTSRGENGLERYLGVERMGDLGVGGRRMIPGF